ncbi:uncharacterized protein LOC144056072 isoform X1 [Vanacampus margaritifer]
MGSLLPNHDGTFQMTAHLKVELPADAAGRYECVFQLAGIKDDMVTKLDRRSILSNKEEDATKVTLAVVVPLTLLALLAPLLVLIVKRHKSPPGEGRKCWPACRQYSRSQTFFLAANYAPASADASDPEPASKSVSEPDAEPASESFLRPIPGPVPRDVTWCLDTTDVSIQVLGFENFYLFWRFI